MGMPYIQEGPGCISFTLAGVPTLIRPSVWLVLVILGSAYSPNYSIVPTLIFVATGILCLLVHEYGHAFSCRALGGGDSIVELSTLGGVTYSNYPPSTRLGHILMVLAGPGASFLLALIGGLILGIHIGDLYAGIVYSLYLPLSGIISLTPDSLFDIMRPVVLAYDTGELSPFVLQCYNTLFIVSIWWTIFNLLPIFPLDGGKTLYLMTDNPRITGCVGITISMAFLIFSLVNAQFFNAFIASYLAYLNYQYFRANRR